MGVTANAVHLNSETTISSADVITANKKGRALKARLPFAVSARYDGRIGRVVVRLSSKVEISFAPEDTEGLVGASAENLEVIEISPSGFGIHFPKLDADIYLPALLEGFTGSKNWMAARLGAEGGSKRSAAKSAAVRKNGKLGGRPALHSAKCLHS